MPFINVKVAGQSLAQGQVATIQAGITALMADILHKVGPLVGVLVEEAPLRGWSVGAEPVACAAQVDAIVSAGTNTPEEKSLHRRDEPAPEGRARLRPCGGVLCRHPRGAA